MKGVEIHNSFLPLKQKSVYSGILLVHKQVLKDEEKFESSFLCSCLQVDVKELNNFTRLVVHKILMETIEVDVPSPI